jgi:hypothetical protein
MASNREPIYLTRDSARRVANAVRAVERMPRATTEGKSIPLIDLPCYYAIVTELIGAGDLSAKKLGSGKGKLQLIKPAMVSGVMTYPYVDWPGQEPVVILNGGPDTIAVGRLIQIKIINGYFNVDVDYCP